MNIILLSNSNNRFSNKLFKVDGTSKIFDLTLSIVFLNNSWLLAAYKVSLPLLVSTFLFLALCRPGALPSPNILPLTRNERDEHVDDWEEVESLFSSFVLSSSIGVSITDISC